MCVGIMSMQRIVNHGSFMQAYGLKSMIESLGHDVKFVDYRPAPCVPAVSYTHLTLPTTERV